MKDSVIKAVFDFTHRIEADGTYRVSFEFRADTKDIDIKYSTVNSSFSYSNYHPKFICARRYYSALIMYEKPSILKQKTFDEFVEDDEINEFFKSHDVIKVDHLPDCYTAVIYRESVGSDD